MEGEEVFTLRVCEVSNDGKRFGVTLKTSEGADVTTALIEGGLAVPKKEETLLVGKAATTQELK